MTLGSLVIIYFDENVRLDPSNQAQLQRGEDGGNMREHGNFNGFHTFAPGVSRRFLLAAIDLYFGRLLFSLWSKAGTGKMCEAFKQRSIDNRKKSLRVTNQGLSLSKSQPENLIADASCSAHEGLQTRGALSHVSHVSHVSHMAPRPQKLCFFLNF